MELQNLDRHLGIFIPSGHTPTQLMVLLDQLLVVQLPEGWTHNIIVFVNGDRPAYDKVYDRYAHLEEENEWFLIGPKIQFIRSKYNQHFSRAVNVGFSLFNEAKYMLLINDDVEMKDPDGVSRLINVLERLSSVATVTPISVFSHEKSAYWSGPVSEAEGAHRMDIHNNANYVPWNNFAIIMFRMDAVRKVGPLRQDRVAFDRYHYYASDYEWNQRANTNGYFHWLEPTIWIHKHHELTKE
jgi:GT2 family glycosyltransferase